MGKSLVSCFLDTQFRKTGMRLHDGGTLKVLPNKLSPSLSTGTVNPDENNVTILKNS